MPTERTSDSAVEGTPTKADDKKLFLAVFEITNRDSEYYDTSVIRAKDKAAAEVTALHWMTDFWGTKTQKGIIDSFGTRSEPDEDTKLFWNDEENESISIHELEEISVEQILEHLEIKGQCPQCDADYSMPSQIEAKKQEEEEEQQETRLPSKEEAEKLLADVQKEVEETSLNSPLSKREAEIQGDANLEQSGFAQDGGTVQKQEENPYPEELTMNQLDEIYPQAETFTDSDEPQSPLERALKFAEETKGQIYTQVDVEDAEHGDIAYSRGNHLVNRTGVYAVIPKFPETIKEAYDEAKKTGNPPVCPSCHHPIYRLEEMQDNIISWLWDSKNKTFSKSQDIGSADKPLHDCNFCKCSDDNADWDYIDFDLVNFAPPKLKDCLCTENFTCTKHLLEGQKKLDFQRDGGQELKEFSVPMVAFTQAITAEEACRKVLKNIKHNGVAWKMGKETEIPPPFQRDGGTVQPSTKCKRCRRTLKNPESIKRGYGSVCFAKMQARISPLFEKGNSKEKLASFGTHLF